MAIGLLEIRTVPRYCRIQVPTRGPSSILASGRLGRLLLPSEHQVKFDQ
jgi:hypothetical protein